MSDDLTRHPGYMGDVPAHSVAAQVKANENNSKYVSNNGDAVQMANFMRREVAKGYKLNTYFPVYDSREDEFRVFVVMEKIQGD